MQGRPCGIVVDKLPAAGYGSTSSTCAIIRTHYSTLEGTAVAYESSFYWKNWAAYLNQKTPKDLARFIQTGAVVFNNKNFDWSKYIKHHDALKIPYEIWTPAQLLERMPHFVDDSYFPPRRPDDPEFFNSPVDKINPVVLFFPGNGYINDPQLSVENLRQASELNGTTFMLNSDLDGFYLANGTSGNQYKNGPVIGQIMARIIEACENGHDHDREPVTLMLNHTDYNLNTGFFSRNRDIVGDSSFSVLG